MRHQHVRLLALVALSAPASALQDVAIVAAASSGGVVDCRFTDVRDYLVASGQFTSVDVLSVNNMTPSLATLLSYDAIITWSNVSYHDPVALGDNLADYVDAGGGVVVAVFANSTINVNRYLQGRWQMGYEIIPAASDTVTGSAFLGTVHDPAHPVMAGVSSFFGGTSSFRPTTTALTPGSTLIAQWDDGSTLVAEGANPKRIDLGMYPPSDNCSGGFWDVTTDGNVLVANALAFVATGGPVGTPYCFGDGTGNPCPCGNTGGPGEGCANSTGAGGVLGASGSNSVAAGDLVLSGAGLVPGAPGLYFQGDVQLGGGLGNAFGDGLRCAGINVVRIEVLVAGGAGTSSTTVDVAAVGMVSAGVVRNYQLWYRDPSGSPCGTSFNLTHGLEITWAP